MNFRIIKALLLRYVILYATNPMRLFELFFWPVVQLLVWGFLTQYLQSQGSGSFPRFITFLIGAIILWDALFRSQQGVSISFLEDVWTRNLLNIFAAPVRMREYLTASFAVGMLRVAITAVLLGVIAAIAYRFNLFQFKLSLIGLYANLMIFGWSLGIISVALIMRWGHGAESLAWAIPFMIQPVSAVFNPVSALPGWLQWIALALPPAHVFEGMRQSIAGNGSPVQSLLTAFGLNLIYFAISALLFGITLKQARERGLLVKVTG